LSVADKTELKLACAAFGLAWTTGYPNRALTPKGHVVVAHLPWFVEMYGICVFLARAASKHSA
jgi:hypothetical protein